MVLIVSWVEEVDSNIIEADTKSKLTANTNNLVNECTITS